MDILYPGLSRKTHTIRARSIYRHQVPFWSSVQQPTTVQTEERESEQTSDTMILISSRKIGKLLGSNCPAEGANNAWKQWEGKIPCVQKVALSRKRKH